MGLSGVKLLVVIGVIAILFLPMLLRHAATIPALLERTRASLAGEDEQAEDRLRDADSRPAHRPPPANLAERLGRILGRLLQRLGLIRAG